MVNRVLKYGLIVAVCAMPALLDSTPANAISWGKKMSNGKVCRVLLGTHTHHGRSGVQATEKAAMSAAVKRWSRFTAWEYGSAWGDISLAQGMVFTCAKTTYGKAWRCLIVAQPCKS